MTASSHGRRERVDGQILVLFAGGLLLLVAILALVVDLGFGLMIRRQEQNAADPAALAAARYIPAKDVSAMWTAACFYAGQNGFAPTRSDTNALCVAGQDDGSRLTVNYPPSRAAGEYAGDAAYVEVRVSRSHRSFFAGAIGLPAIEVATSAVAANDDGSGGTSSLVALHDTMCGAGNIHGSGGGGGLLSNLSS